MSTLDLLRRLGADVGTLVQQQFALSRAEAREQLRQVGLTLVLVAAAASMLAAGGFWILIAITRGFADLFDLPVWGGYAVVGLLLTIAGALLAAAAQPRLRAIRILPKTQQSLRGHVEWVMRAAGRSERSEST